MTSKSYKLYYFPHMGREEIARVMFACAGIKYEDIRIPYKEWPVKKSTMPFEQLPVLEVDDTVICQSGAIVRFVAKQCGYNGKTDLEEAKADMITECVFDIMMRFPWTEEDEQKKLWISTYTPLQKEETATPSNSGLTLDVCNRATPFNLFIERHPVEGIIYEEQTPTTSLNFTLSISVTRPASVVQSLNKQILEDILNNSIPKSLKKLETMLVKEGGDFFTGQFSYADIALMNGGQYLLEQKEDIFDQTPTLKAHLRKIENMPDVAKWIAIRPKGE